MTIQKHLLIFTIWMVTGSLWATAPDYEREKRLTDEYIDALVIGEPVELHDGKRDFIGIMTESEDENPRGAIMILHGRGFHPASPTVVQPLRIGLPEQGWATLSLQMPVLGKEATYYDYVPLFPEARGRIAAGLQYLHDAGYEPIVILAHSCGAHMAMNFVHEKGDKGFDAYIGIGMSATDYQQPMRQPYPLEKMTGPVLDIYGANDFPAVRRLAPGRKAMMVKACHAKSRQIVIPNADHYYKEPDSMGVLEQEIIKWLDDL